MEVGRNARDFKLTIIELPLDEQRAWYLEPDKIIMSHELMSSRSCSAATSSRWWKSSSEQVLPPARAV